LQFVFFVAVSLLFIEKGLELTLILVDLVIEVDIASADSRNLLIFVGKFLHKFLDFLLEGGVPFLGLSEIEF
jgi:hypothetical protein